MGLAKEAEEAVTVESGVLRTDSMASRIQEMS